MLHIISNPYDGKPITDDNIEDYILTNELNYNGVKLKEYKQLSQFPLLNQRDFGIEDNCTPTAITECIKFYYPNFIETNQNIHDTVWAIYKRNHPRFLKFKGIVPFVNDELYRDTFFYYNLSFFKTKIRYGYRIGFNYKSIKRQIEAGNPVILSFKTDGRNFYKEHTVVVIGYAEYTVTSDSSLGLLFPEKTKKMLIIADGSGKNIRYLDPSCLSTFSCIVY